MQLMSNSIGLIGSRGYLGSRILELLQKENFNLHAVDLHNSEEFEDCIKDNPLIIWAAGLSDHDLGKKDPSIDMQRNCVDPIQAAMQLKSGQTFLHISSTCVYGNIEGIVNENTTPNPQEPQAFSKVYAEQMLRYLSKISGFKLINLRCSAIVGDKKANEPLALLEKILLNSAANMITDMYGGPNRSCIFTPLSTFCSFVHQLIVENLSNFEVINLATHQLTFGNLAKDFLLNFLPSKTQVSHIIESVHRSHLPTQINSYEESYEYLKDLQNELRKCFSV